MILGLETSGRVGSVALGDGQSVLGSLEFDTQQEAVRHLPGAIQELLRATEEPVEGLAVSRGPGSFNGLRVGIALAKAMAHAWRVPVVGIPTPLAWAAESAARFPDEPVVVLQPSRREHLYLTLVGGSGEDSLEVRRGPEVVKVEELSQVLQEILAGCRKAVVTGDWADLEAWAAGYSEVQLDPRRAVSPSAVTIMQLGGGRLTRLGVDSHFGLRPEYVSRSQAERNWGVNLGL